MHLFNESQLMFNYNNRVYHLRKNIAKEKLTHQLYALKRQQVISGSMKIISGGETALFLLMHTKYYCFTQKLLYPKNYTFTI